LESATFSFTFPTTADIEGAPLLGFDCLLIAGDTSIGDLWTGVRLMQSTIPWSPSFLGTVGGCEFSKTIHRLQVRCRVDVQTNTLFGGVVFDLVPIFDGTRH
jgi:hypothetical protein